MKIQPSTFVALAALLFFNYYECYPMQFSPLAASSSQDTQAMASVKRILELDSYNTSSQSEIERKLRKLILYTLLNGQPCQERMPHPNNPSKFIMCLADGDFTVMSCPDALVYNAHLDRCDYTLTLEPRSACETLPCRNGGRCVDVAGDLTSYRCECEAANGAYGARCEHLPDYCASSPCGANGKCHAVASATAARIVYYCTCYGESYFGTSCASTASLESNPCTGPASTGLMFPTLIDPSLFVQCDSRTPYVKSCGADSKLIFSPALGRCDWSTLELPPKQQQQQQQQQPALMSFQTFKPAF